MPSRRACMSLLTSRDSTNDCSSRLPARACGGNYDRAVRRDVRPAPGPGSKPGRLLERPAERGLRVVADLRADRGDLGAALGQEVGRDLHPPLRQVLHRRLADELGETLGQAGAGGCRLSSQVGEGPGVRGPAMQQRQRPPDHFVTESGEPAGLARRQVVEIAAQDLDEHQLRQPREDGVGPGAAEPRLLGHFAREAGEPGMRQAAHVHPAGQGREQRIERTSVAAEEPADERRIRPPPVAKDDDVRIAGGGGAVHLQTEPEASPARHHVGVAVGKDDHVARDQLDLVLADQATVAAAVGEDVVRDQVLRGRHDPGRELLGGRGLDAPGPRRLDREEEGAIQADDAQQVGERVHGGETSGGTLMVRVGGLTPAHPPHPGSVAAFGAGIAGERPTAGAGSTDARARSYGRCAS